MKRVVYDAPAIQQRVRELGAEITAAYPEGDLLVLGLLKGSFIFLSDLVRNIERPLQVDFLVASSYGMDFAEGDEIVVSIMEHHSNIVPWNYHRERRGTVIKWTPVADDGTFLMDEFERLLTAKTPWCGQCEASA